ncbi:Ykof family thiamine-binding protein [Georgenia sp. EYE_87]|uniref:Ykof family thiamine-binding protein n=1 Tax=Georgenia sp. EYE_87 TaxID=2853448 RepID=UPI00200471D6|nr:Ykof family thiamine-binding protein [Georgenia sp. EYE_87]MCK6212301.1 Ykof family thiamine-binding protein [Georgenia sp. EYE_87]
MSTKIDETTTPAAPTPAELGIGMRFSIHPHTDGFVEVILGALADVEAAGLTDGLVIDTDEVSTYVGATAAPAEQRLAAYLAAVIAASSRRSGGGHVVAHVLLSRGCPGEVSCNLAVTGLPSPDPVAVEPTGIRAAAHWSLYPLIDGGSDDGDHMAHIEAAIAVARERGTLSPAHYATKLTGDVAEVLATAVDAWAQVGAHVPHVVTHLTVSVGSPIA